MSSILTNTSAMVALQTLKGINSGLASTQAQISTGKSIASAKDNAAVWAISKVMESDVKGFQGISDSLALGESTVAVARQASETVTNLLTEMKGKIVAAQELNVDKAKIKLIFRRCAIRSKQWLVPRSSTASTLLTAVRPQPLTFCPRSTARQMAR